MESFFSLYALYKPYIFFMKILQEYSENTKVINHVHMIKCDAQ